MSSVKESATVSAGLTAPHWIPLLNDWIGLLIGVATLIYILSKTYWLFRCKGAGNDRD